MCFSNQSSLDNNSHPYGALLVVEKQRQDANQLGVLEAELQQVERQLRVLKREQNQLLQWLKGFPEETVEAENKRINASRNSLQLQKTGLEMQIQASREAAVSLQLVREKLTTLDFDMKCLALDMLNIKVWIDGLDIEITGTIPVENADIVTTSSWLHSHNTPLLPFSLRVETGKSASW